MRLSELIRTDTERIIREWEEFAKTLSAGVGLPRWLLRVHAAAILQSIAQDIDTPKLPVKQQAKSEGSPGPLEHVAAAHVNLRIESGFDLAQIMAEYRALRACVLRLWCDTDPAGFALGAEEITRFTDAIDQAVAETVPIYAQREAQYRDRFLGILGHDLRNPLNAILLSATALAGGKEVAERQLGAVSRILSSVRRVDHMVNDILDFARGRLGTPMAITPVRDESGDSRSGNRRRSSVG